MNSLVESFKNYTNEEVQELPTLEFHGEIVLITTEDEARAAALELSQHKALGFDTETRPSFKKGQVYPISLLQLATEDKVFLFRNLLFKMPQELIAILENPGIAKAGVAYHDDIKGLQKLFPLKAQGMVELADLSNKHNIKANGLRGITASVLHQKLSKKAKLTNWQASSLTAEQLRYAAIDAWVGLLIYQKLV